MFFRSRQWQHCKGKAQTLHGAIIEGGLHNQGTKKNTEQHRCFIHHKRHEQTQTKPTAWTAWDSCPPTLPTKVVPTFLVFSMKHK
jgi:hypothetical protein